MEKKNYNIIIIIILSLFVVGLTGFIVYDKNIINKGVEEKVNINKENIIKEISKISYNIEKSPDKLETVDKEFAGTFSLGRYEVTSYTLDYVHPEECCYDSYILSIYDKDDNKIDYELGIGYTGKILVDETNKRIIFADYEQQAPGGSKLVALDFDGNIVFETQREDAFFEDIKIDENGNYFVIGNNSKAQSRIYSITSYNKNGEKINDKELLADGINNYDVVDNKIYITSHRDNNLFKTDLNIMNLDGTLIKKISINDSLKIDNLCDQHIFNDYLSDRVAMFVKNVDKYYMDGNNIKYSENTKRNYMFVVYDFVNNKIMYTDLIVELSNMAIPYIYSLGDNKYFIENDSNYIITLNYK